MIDLLLHNLRTIGTHHCDGTVGEEAADEIERLRAEVAGLREALQGVLPWVVTQEVACNGLKCREPICMSCDSDSEANAQLACNAYAKASAALAARKGEA